jgi:hypothetical protein
MTVGDSAHKLHADTAGAVWHTNQCNVLLKSMAISMYNIGLHVLRIFGGIIISGERACIMYCHTIGCGSNMLGAYLL